MSIEIEAFGKKWKRVWRESAAIQRLPFDPDHEYVTGAWKRLFQEDLPARIAADEASGDGLIFRFGDRMFVMAYDGDSIYVLAEATAPFFVSSSVTGSMDVAVSGALVPSPDPYTAMVSEFHQRMGLVARDAPSLGTPAEREERVRLMLEELLEVARALGVTVLADSAGMLGMDALTFFSDHAPDLPGVLHELADLQVTVSGTAVQFGLPLLAATREVHAANMRKTPQGPGRKPLKPAGWEAADVASVLQSGGVALRQLAGADASQPPSVVLGLQTVPLRRPHRCDRAECRPFAVRPCACGCVCHEVTP